MAGSTIKKRPQDDERWQRPAKRPKIVRKQKAYHSSSEDEDSDEPEYQAIDLAKEDEDDAVETNIAQASLNALHNAGEESSASEDEADNTQPGADAETDPTSASEASEDDDQDNDEQPDSDDPSETSTAAERKRKKRNDPDAFATSISKILGSKLSTSKRADPVLSRSKAAAETTQARTESKLEEKAKRKLRDDKKKASERGRIKDVLAGGEERLTAQEVAEREKRLRKTAQRGVVKLFNAFAAAHRKAEEVSADTKRQGVVGIDQRREKVQDMSKEAFLDLIAGGGKAAA